MREIRTYGLMRGCWPERFVRRVGVYSTGLSRKPSLAPSREVHGDTAIAPHVLVAEPVLAAREGELFDDLVVEQAVARYHAAIVVELFAAIIEQIAARIAELAAGGGDQSVCRAGVPAFASVVWRDVSVGRAVCDDRGLQTRAAER